MKLLNFYQPAIQNERTFVNSFNDNLQEMARHFWHDMNGAAPGLIGVALFVGIVVCCYYYGPYNNKPGRHYKPSHWAGFMLFNFLATLLLTEIYEHLLVKTTLKGAGMTMFWIALQNAVYSTIFVYLPMSIVWCKFWKTKAYRIF